jgi:hypothetical protein
VTRFELVMAHVLMGGIVAAVAFVLCCAVWVVS